MTTFTITVAPILFGGWRSIRPGFKTASAFNNWMNDKRQKNKNEHVNYVQELMNSFSYDEGSIKGPVRNITRYIEATRRKIEIIKVGDSIYTNLPA
jgi:carbamate kinase